MQPCTCCYFVAIKRKEEKQIPIYGIDNLEYNYTEIKITYITSMKSLAIVDVTSN